MYEFDDRLACANMMMRTATYKLRKMMETKDYSLSKYMDVANCVAEAYIYLDELISDSKVDMHNSLYKQLNDICKNLQPK